MTDIDNVVKTEDLGNEWGIKQEPSQPNVKLEYCSPISPIYTKSPQSSGSSVVSEILSETLSDCSTVEEVVQRVKWQLPSNDEVYSSVARHCQCSYHQFNDEDSEWSKRGFERVRFRSGSTAVYKPGTNKAATIVISDAIGTELMGTREMMAIINSKRGHHVIKPMLYEANETHTEFLEMVSNYYTKGEGLPQLPVEIEKTKEFLFKRGVKSISLLGFCWGGCIVQQIISTNDDFVCGVSIDGLYYQPSFAALVPSLFVMSQGRHGKETTQQMQKVMWNNNIYPWEMRALEFPLEHGHILTGFQCAKKTVIVNDVGCTDDELKYIVNLIIQSHVTHIQMIEDYICQFN